MRKNGSVFFFERNLKLKIFSCNFFTIYSVFSPLPFDFLFRHLNGDLGPCIV